MVQGQVFLKGGGGEGAALSLFNFFKVICISFLHLEFFLPFAFAKLFYAFEEKLFFTAAIILCTW